MKQIQQEATSEDAELPSVLGKLKDKIENTLKILESFQTKNSESIFSTGCFLLFICSYAEITSIVKIFHCNTHILHSCSIPCPLIA